jgi:hypothetical protein
MFQKGTDLEVTLVKGGAKITLKNPPHLHSDLNRLSNVALLRAVVELTGGKKVTCEMSDTTPTRAVYDSRWT